jgi:precorrin-6B methylase 2
MILNNYSLFILAFICIIGLLNHRFAYFRHLKQWRWRKQLNIDRHQRRFQQLYQNVNGFQLSKQARQKGDAFEYTYGEIEFLPFIALLTLIPIDKNTIFYDLGSGSGKAVIAAAMVFEMKKCCGIEIFTELHETANQQLEKLQNTRYYQTQTEDIHFLQNNFLNVPLNEATVIFINSTAFFGKHWENINDCFDGLIQCEYIISTSKALCSNSYQIIRKTRMAVSWGDVQVFIHKRIKL